MKLHGSPLRTSFVHSFLLPRPAGESLTVQLAPLPLGFHQRLRERGICPPAPPVKIARDSTGKPLRDPQGTAVTLADLQHPDYLMESERYHQRVAVLAVAQSLAADPHLTFDALPPAGDAADAWRSYADQLFSEMEHAGFTAGDLILLCREICRLSNLVNDHLTAAQANFSPSTAGNSS